MANTDTPQPWTGVTEGRIVHVRKPEIGHCIPAIVVRRWESSNGSVNVLLFPDGGNDGLRPVNPGPDGRTPSGDHGAVYGLPWATSVPHESGGGPLNWHWPERA